MSEYKIDYDKRFKRFYYHKDGKVIGMSDILETLNYQQTKIAELEKKIFIDDKESYEAVNRAINIILEKDDRISELEQQLEKYSRSDLVWLARHEVKGLDQEQTGVINLNKIKADAVRDALGYRPEGEQIYDGDCVIECALQYAEKLERGEL